MNNKKIQAQMQIDVSFLNKGLSLTKDIQSQLDKVKFTGPLTKHFTDDMSKQFKAIETNYNKMIASLSKKGLSSKQYTAIFEEGSLAIKKNIDSIRDIGKALKEAYNSKEQKDLLKGLEAQKQLLIDIKKLQTSMKQSNAAGARATNKLKEEFGLDFGNSQVRNAIKAVKERRESGKSSITGTQKTVLGTDDPAKIERIVKLYNQIISALDKVKIKQAEINAVGGVEGLQKKISLIEKNIITQEQLDEVMGMEIPILKELNEELPQMNANLKNAESQAEKTAKASQSFKEVLAQFGIVFSAASLARGVKNLIKDSFDFYKSLDSALNQIYVVSNLTSKQVDGLKNNFINMAKETGMALDDVTRSAVLFYQQGLSTKEVLTMTEVTAQFAKVAGIDATDAADKLTAAVNGYCLSAENAAEVADKFNKVAAVSAADINELSTAFSKAAAQANQAGVSMDNYLAYIATMEEATREAPENLGTSLKTIFSRMQQIKTGENTEDDTDVNAVETALRSVGIALRDTSGQLRDLEEIFDELGPKWNGLDRNTQAYLGTIIAGTRQQSRFITLMQNWDRVLELSEESANSAGQQALMHAKAMESIESKLNQLSVAWQEFISNLTSSATFKGIIDTLRNFLNLINDGYKPMMLMVTAVTLLSNKLNDLQAPLVNKGKDFLGIFGIGNSQRAISTREKKAKLKDKDSLITNAEANLRKTIMERPNDTEDIQAQKERLNLYKQERAELAGQVTHAQKLGKGLQAAGVAAQGLGMVLAQDDEIMGSMVASVGGMVTGIGQMAQGKWLSGLVSFTVSAIQMANTFKKSSEVSAKKLTDAANKVKKATQEVGNKTIANKSLDALIKKYDELSRKTYRTATEQKELNSTIQTMADSIDGIEAYSDAYGNLSINIDAVRQKYKTLDDERAKALKDLQKTEQEEIKNATSGLFNTNDYQQAIQEIVSANISTYRNLISGINDELTASQRGISQSLYNQINENFKSSILSTIQQNAEYFARTKEGLGGSAYKLGNDLNAKIDSKAWNDIYNEIEYFQKRVNSLDWNDFQSEFERVFGALREQLGLTTDEWLVLQSTIQSSIYGDKEYIDYMSQADADSAYSKTVKKEMEDRKKQLQEDLEGVTYTRYSTRAANSLGSKKVGSYTGFEEIYQKYKDMGYGDMDFRDNWSEYVKGNNYGDFSGSNLSDEELERRIQQYDAWQKKYAEILKNETGLSRKMEELTFKESEYIRTVGTLFDYKNFFAIDKENDSKAVQESKESAQKYIESINAGFVDAVKGADSTTEGALKGEEWIQRQLGLVDENSDLDDDTKTRIKSYLNKMSEEVEKEIPRVGTSTWSSVLGDLDNYTEGLKKANNAMMELNENGAISHDTFSELAGMMDNLNLEDVFNSFGAGREDEALQYVDSLCEAMKNLNVQYDENTGAIKVNEDSLKSLQDAQQLMTKAKIDAEIKDLKSQKALAESNEAYYTAQIAGIQAMIDYLDDEKTVKVETNKMMTAADGAYTSTLTTEMGKIEQSYTDLSDDHVKWAEVTINNLAEVSDAWSQYWEAVRNGESKATKDSLKKKAENLQKGVFNSGKDSFDTFRKQSNINLKDYENVEKGSDKYNELKGKLQDYKRGLEEAKLQWTKTIAVNEGRIQLLESMKDMDLSNWGTGKDGGKGLEKYIGQLKEIYNILNRIQMLEHRLSTLDTYADMAKGKDYGNLLQERLSYNNELLDQYQFLVSEQKQFTNGYKDFIGSVEGLEDVFEFDKFGQIIINWEKYNALQDEAAEGQISLKEKADDVYNTYTSMMDELQGYFDKYISYLKNTLNLLNEMKDNYVDLEEKAAAAVKEIYQKELDAKLEAIDKEMKALEELTKARQKANKERDNAKVLSGYQADLQRAMMDTSGASDANYLKAQQNISDKLDAMAEDKYSEMIDDIKSQLEEEKEVLQNNFDELFENLDWLYDYLDQDVMGDQTKLYQLLKGTDDWQKKSPTQKWQDMKDWDTKFFSYAQNDLFGAKGIKGLLDDIDKKETEYQNLDMALQNQNSKGDANIAQTIQTWGQKVANAASSSGGGGGSSYITSNGGNDSRLDSVAPTYIKKSIGVDSPKEINKDALTNGVVDEGKVFGAVDDNGKKYQPNNVGGSRLREAGMNAAAIWLLYNSSGKPISGQNVWKSDAGNIYVWNGTKGEYEMPSTLYGKYGNQPLTESMKKILNKLFKGAKYAQGGFANFTGPAWLDGTSTAPEAVLDALQTKHFIDFTNTLDKMYSNVGQAGVSNASSVTIDNISFNVESMSSPEDGEKAFNAFVDKFKEIGDRTGLKVQTFKNTL